MSTYKYFKWDGTEPFAFDKEKLMDELSRRLMADGNLSDALWKMQNMGIRDIGNRQLPSLKELLRRLQEKRQGQLNRYNLDSVTGDIRKALEDILKTERAGIQKKLDEVRQKAQQSSGGLTDELKQKLTHTLEEKAADNLARLDNLPKDIGGQVKELNDYEFMDEDARRKFQDLMNMLKKRAVDTYARELGQTLQNMDKETLQELKQMMRALNDMLEQRMRGQEPDFDNFMKRFGRFFGPDPPKSLDELIERLHRQMAQSQSLLNSMSDQQRAELENLMDSIMDQGMRDELGRLGANIQVLSPYDFSPSQYDFGGSESISYNEALKLMEMLQKMDSLEQQINDARYGQSTEDIDRNMLKELLGNQAAEELDAINSISKLLEESGYLRREGNKYSLTPLGMRKIGEKALNTVFASLKKDRTGGHTVMQRGSGGERIDETKKYEFGDDFDLHIEKTIMNALRRKAAVPVKILADDFEVFREEQTTRSATVLMLDMSLSMRMNGNFQAAKIVTIALNSLISGKYPKDSLYILGFSAFARRMTPEDLTYISWDDFTPYTNMQHGFMTARKLLEKDRSANKQIIMISDGQPTAHIENGNIAFQLPTSRRCLEITLKEVINCTRAGIVINTFMLQGRDYSTYYFVSQMARMNHGRVFFTSPSELGKYVIVDYLNNKKAKI